MHGSGEFTWKNQMKYIGEYKVNKFISASLITNMVMGKCTGLTIQCLKGCGTKVKGMVIL
jgi:hypothetical protein